MPASQSDRKMPQFRAQTRLLPRRFGAQRLLRVAVNRFRRTEAMSDSTHKPEFREDDAWFSDEQRAKLTPADHVEDLRSPIPTQMVSNGEYMPEAETEQEKRSGARTFEVPAGGCKERG